MKHRFSRRGVLLIAILWGGSAIAQGTRNSDVRKVYGQWAQYYARQYGIPVELVAAVIEEESGWNPNAVSVKGAAGLMQLMPGTAARLGVRNRFRPDENIRGGVAYLAWLNRLFRGDLRLVTAAYYAGERGIERRGLNYSNADVHGYVSRVARRYRALKANRRR